MAWLPDGRLTDLAARLLTGARAVIVWGSGNA